MNRDDVKLATKETVSKSYLQVDRYVLEHRAFEGDWIGPMTREVLERGHAVAALLYDPDLDLLVLVEQFRAGVYAAQMSSEETPWLMEVVAGIIEDGEEPEGVTRREAVEEAGCDIVDMFEVGQYYLSPGVCTETITLYCARVDASNAGGHHGLDHEHEDIRVHVVSSEQAFDWLEHGKITNATALIALQWFKLHFTEVRNRWM